MIFAGTAYGQPGRHAIKKAVKLDPGVAQTEVAQQEADLVNGDLFLYTFVHLGIFGLEPGRFVWLNTYFQPDDTAEYPYPYASAQLISTWIDGYAQTVFPLDFLTDHEVGTLTGWASDTLYGDPIQTVYGPAEKVQHIP